MISFYKKINFLFFVSIFLVATACTTTKTATNKSPKTDDKIDIAFLQINDVYEISPLEGGKVGGLARIATLRKQLVKENANTTTIMAGDFFNPSVIGTLKYEGKKISGKQMIEVLNEMGLQYAAFGNHEFDIKENEVEERLNESRFEYISGNVMHQKGDIIKPFEQKGKPIAAYKILTFTDADGTSVRVGIIAETIPMNKQPFVWYGDERDTYKATYNLLKDSTDFMVAITHLNVADDLALAKLVPQIPLIMGGHDHNHQLHKTDGGVTVAKADANAKTAYIHRISFDKRTKKASITSTLVNIDEKIAEDAATKAIADKWEAIAQKSFMDLGFNPKGLVYTTKEPLDGREQIVRSQPALLPQLIAKSMLAASPNMDCAFFNGGSIRIDDILQGAVNEYDIIRTLPYGGNIVNVEIRGSLLRKILNIGTNQNKGTGDYLQYAGINLEKKDWTINGAKLDETKLYKVATNDYTMSGKLKNLDFIKDGTDGIGKIQTFANDKTDLRRDLRLAFIDYLRGLKN